MGLASIVVIQVSRGESDRYTCVLVTANIWTGTTNGLVTVTKALGQTALAEDTRETR